MILIYVLLVLFVNSVFSDVCTIYDFENDFDEIFDSTRSPCTSLPSWELSAYNNTVVPRPNDKSQYFMSPIQTGSSCISSFDFWMDPGGVVEIYVFMIQSVPQDMLNIILYMYNSETGDPNNVGSAAFIPTGNQEWEVISISVLGSASYMGYISFISLLSGSQSLLLVDSFRYIPPGVSSDDTTCQIYLEEVPTDTFTIPPVETEATTNNYVTDDPTTSPVETEATTNNYITDDPTISPVETEPTTNNYITEDPTTSPVETEATTNNYITDDPTTSPIETEPTTNNYVTDDPTTSPVETEATTNNYITDDPTTSPVETEPTTNNYVTDDPTTSPVETEATTNNYITDDPTTSPVETEPTTNNYITDDPTTSPVETEPTTNNYVTDDPTTSPVETEATTNNYITDDPTTSPVETEATTNNYITDDPTTSPVETEPTTNNYVTDDPPETDGPNVTEPPIQPNTSDPTEDPNIEETTDPVILPSEEKGFWTALTITMAVLLGFIILVTVAIISYYLGKRNSVQVYVDDFDIDNLPKPILVPRVKNIYPDINRNPYINNS